LWFDSAVSTKSRSARSSDHNLTREGGARVLILTVSSSSDFYSSQSLLLCYEGRFNGGLGTLINDEKLVREKNVSFNVPVHNVILFFAVL
jgi:hypothetical protein